MPNDNLDTGKDATCHHLRRHDLDSARAPLRNSGARAWKASAIISAIRSWIGHRFQPSPLTARFLTKPMNSPLKHLRYLRRRKGDDQLDPAGVAGFCFAMMALIVLIRVLEDIVRHFIQG